MTSREHVYKITEIVRVVDADTCWLRCDIGFRQTLLVNIRLLGYDAPEKNRGSIFERNRAKVAQALTSAFLTEPGGALWVRTEKDPDDFGRWLGDIWVEAGDSEHHLGDGLAAEGLATVWPNRWRDTYDKGSKD